MLILVTAATNGKPGGHVRPSFPQRTRRRLHGALLSLLLVFLVLALLLPAGTGCRDHVGKKVVGVLMCDLSDQFQVYIVDGMREEEKRLENVRLIIMDGKYDSNRQLQQAESFMAQDVNAIILMAVDRFAARPILKMARDEGIPVISMNRRLADQAMAVSYVGSEDIQAGEIEMRAVAEALGGKGTVAIIEGDYGNEPQIRRRMGYDNILKQYPEIKVAADNTGKWYRDKGMAVMENWLQAGLKFDAVVAENDEMAIGAMKAGEEAGLKSIIFAGIDGTPEALVFVADGELKFTVFQDAAGQGGTAVRVAAELLDGRQVKKEYLIPFELVTRENVEKYQKRYRDE